MRLIVEETVGRLSRELDGRADEISILDPACGNGAFLMGAHEYLAARCAGSRKRLLNCIYGADLDEVALSQARRNLHAADSCTGAHLIHGDSLMNVDWHGEFPEIMARGGFDAVIGNPPWVSLAGRFGIRAYRDAEIEHLRRRFGGNSYMPNLFEYFVSLGLELTRPGGYFSFIVPDRLGFNRQFELLRRKLLLATELLTLVHGIRFPGVVADTMVFVCRKTPPGRDAITETRDWSGLSSSLRQADLLARPGCEFARPEDPRTGGIVRRMESLGGPMLGEVCEITSGFGGRSSLIADRRTSDDQIPVLKGESIERYAVRKEYWFDFRAENLTGRTRVPAKLGASPKILIRKTGDRLIAAYDDSGRFPEQSLYFLFGFRDFDPRFVLGILNSRLMGVYYEARCLTNRRTIAHAKMSDLARIPLPPVRPEQHDRLVALVDEMLKTRSCEADIDRLVWGLYGVEMEDLPPETW